MKYQIFKIYFLKNTNAFKEYFPQIYSIQN